MPVQVDWDAVARFLAAIKDISVAGALWLVLIGGAFGKWVWGHHYQQVLTRLERCEEQNRWLQEQLMAAVTMTNRVVEVAETRRRKP